MQINLIFERKVKNDQNYPSAQSIFKEMFNLVFEQVTINTFVYKIDNTPYTIDYKCSGVNDEIYYLSVSHNFRPSIDAKVLNLVTKCIQNGIHRKDFYIFYAYDETSEYYCAKLAPRFGKFERLMREFIYVNLTISLKSQWFEQSFTEDLKNEIKAKLNNQNSLIEQALYEMTFAQLYDFLFVEYAYTSPNCVIYERLLPLDLENTDKQTIIDAINTCKKVSLWDRYFLSSQMDLKDYLNDMREYRNKVAHNKFITSEEYEKCTKNLKIINKQLSLAINNLYSQVYSEETWSYIGTLLSTAFSEFFKNNSAIFDAVQQSLSTLGKIYSEISDSLTKNFRQSISNINKIASIPITPVKIEGSSCLRTASTTCQSPIQVKIDTSTPLEIKTKNNSSILSNIKTSNHIDNVSNKTSSSDISHENASEI